MTEEFQFSVTRVDYDLGPETIRREGRLGAWNELIRHPIDMPRWRVDVLGECVIGEERGHPDTGWRSGVPHDMAVAALERLIDEAQEALAALREGRQL